MTSLYLASFLFGGVLIGASVLLGGGEDLDVDGDFDVDGDLDLDGDLDMDVDGDLDIDGDIDADHGGALAHVGDTMLEAGDTVGPDAAVWMPFMSMRFWTFGTAAFGLVGLILSVLISSAALTGAFAAIGGITGGWSAAYAFRVLATKSVSGETTTKRFVGQEAKVVLPIRPGKQGRIALQTYQGRLDMLAQTQDEHELALGEAVLIASIRDGVANVTRLRPEALALLSQSEPT
ncbi:MAG: hypothetical protein KC912_20965 [Proteobacteria bacterium]|nr:hypothetical protein [Pseudomonadota bacterium]